MMAALDPLSFPLAMDIVSGQNADDRLSVPVLTRALACFPEKGKVVVGDSKMSATETRASLQTEGQWY